MQIGMARDASILAMSGASQAALGLNGNRQFLLIQNTGANVLAINFSGPATGGTGPAGVGNAASIGGTGCITLAPNERFPPSGMDWIPQNPVNLIGTAGQPVAIIEG